jgi:hypothetical protein
MGILVAHGAPFKAEAIVENATLYDVAPTLLYLLDQPIPASFDGQLLTGALTDSWLQNHRPRYAIEDQGSPSEPPVSMSPEDEEKVMGRLRALGYVE